MQHDYLIESNILFWYRKSKFLARNDYPLDSKKNFLSRVNDFSRTKSNNFMLIPILFPNWSLINIAPKWNRFRMKMIWLCYKRIFFFTVDKFKYLLTKFLVQNDFPFGAKGNGSNVHSEKFSFKIKLIFFPQKDIPLDFGLKIRSS